MGKGLKDYAEFIQKCKEAKHVFVSSLEDVDVYAPAIWLRHDVDCWPPAALEMAKTESYLDVPSTYFFCLDSPFYNLMLPENIAIVDEITSLGFDVGLHVYYPKDSHIDYLADAMVSAIVGLEAYFDTPTLHGGGGVACPSAVTNDPNSPEYVYLADSNNRPLNFSPRPDDQVLYEINLHPEWWTGWERIRDLAAKVQDTQLKAMWKGVKRW